MGKLRLHIILAIACLGLLLGCTNNSNSSTIKAKGLPEDDLQNPSMYFISKDTGYICLSKCEDGNHEEQEFSTYLYETKDGGLNWTKVAFLPGQYVDNMVANSEAVFLTTLAMEQKQMTISKYDINKQKLNIICNFDAISSSWINNNTLYFCEVNDSNKLYVYNDSIKILAGLTDYINRGFTIDGQVFAIFSNKETNYFGDIKTDYQLPIIPNCLIKKEGQVLLIAGKSKTKNNSIKLVEFDCLSKQSKIVKEFVGYSVVDDLQTEGNIIVGFIGNMSSSVIEYDLLYSLDRGKNWKIIKLDDRIWVRPNCLSGENLLIYKGFNQFDKIVLN
jgi:hypothetical protein